MTINLHFVNGFDLGCGPVQPWIVNCLASDLLYLDWVPLEMIILSLDMILNPFASFLDPLDYLSVACLSNLIIFFQDQISKSNH